MELGKISTDIPQVEKGIACLRNTYHQLVESKLQDKELHSRIMTKYKLAQRVLTIMQMQLEDQTDKKYLADLKKKFSSMQKLYKIKKVPAE